MDPETYPAPRDDMPPVATSGEPMMRYFTYSHLPGALQDVSKLFHACALAITINLPRSAERTVALRKLLEAKDAAVRCAVFDSPVKGGG